jgi:hypothetical protein
MLNGANAWYPNSNSGSGANYIELTLTELTYIGGLVIQAKPDLASSVTQIKVKVYLDSVWIDVDSGFLFDTGLVAGVPEREVKFVQPQ